MLLRGVERVRGRRPPGHADRRRRRQAGQRGPAQGQRAGAAAREHAEHAGRRSSRGSATCDLLFEQADTTLTPPQFFGDLGAAWRSSACSSPVFAGLHAGIVPLMGVAAGVAAAGVAAVSRRKRRLQAFAKQLPDALELIARALARRAQPGARASTWSPRKCRRRSARNSAACSRNRTSASRWKTRSTT